MQIKFIDFQQSGDDRGELVVLEEGKQIPFAVKRIYYMFGTGKGVKRGAHAHKRISQIAIPITGSCTMLLDNGVEKKEVLLNDRTKGLLLENFIWREMYNFSKDCVLLLLASELYDESEYVRNYNDFLALSKKMIKEK